MYLKLGRIFAAILLLIAPLAGGEALANPSSNSGLKNPCGEGSFLDLYYDQCRSLDKNFGFSFNEFNKNHKSMVVNVTNCGENSLQDALAKVKSNGGGTINLGACTYNITEAIKLPGNTLLQGKGQNKTTLKYVKGFGPGQGLIKTYPNANIIIRDLSVIGDGSIGKKKLFNFDLQASKNILVERVESIDAGRSSIDASHSQKITVRYSNLFDSAKKHGIAAKDCFPRKGVWSKTKCSNKSSSFWAENFAIYSNTVSGNKQHGLDFHVSSLEMGGNIVEHNKFGVKIPEPATNVWIHDNYIADNTVRGIASKTQYGKKVDKSMQVANHVYYRNQIIDNAKKAQGFSVLRGKNIILIDNVFQGNGGGNKWTSKSGQGLDTTISVCEGDELLKAHKGRTKVSIVSGSKCDLSKVSKIFG